MIWESMLEVIVLHRHNQRVQHIHNSGLSSCYFMRAEGQVEFWDSFLPSIQFTLFKSLNDSCIEEWPMCSEHSYKSVLASCFFFFKLQPLCVHPQWYLGLKDLLALQSMKKNTISWLHFNILIFLKCLHIIIIVCKCKYHKKQI